MELFKVDDDCHTQPLLNYMVGYYVVTVLRRLGNYHEHVSMCLRIQSSLSSSVGLSYMYYITAKSNWK